MATIQDTKENIDNSAERLSANAREAANEAKGEFRKLGAKLRSNTSNLEDDLCDAGQRFAEGTRKFSEAAAEQIREHPLAAFGVAFAAGMVITRWMRRR
ncbi:MAG: hypothetical protein WB784_06465 [Rhodanobacteraceae bacterium]